ncbi:MAG: decarboxylating 6-phosphogluconate dehydrogenase [Candidatus Daviesbacteria bacterium]|nr:decarboxylating 6-phosphogluconate dehydrogenase [Candidatus Daviesbacteria bacterium]
MLLLKDMKIGFIGLGRMGANIVLHLLEGGIEVVAWNRSLEPREELRKEALELKTGSENLTIAESIDELVSNLEGSRTIWLMITAGEAVDAVITDLVSKIDKGDLIIDGGNSFYQDSIRHGKELAGKGIHFMDVGTSGGVESARHGACLMIGGSLEDFERAEPIFKAEAAAGGYGLLGEVGAGHFAKMIHNGIEYGMMEAIGEGAAILKNSQFNYDLRKVFQVYSVQSIIESRLTGWTLAELKNDPNLDNISSVIGSAGGAGKTKGEGHWTVEIAKGMGIDTPVIAASVAVRDNSDKDEENSPNGFRNKIVAAMRWQFGRHPVKKS